MNEIRASCALAFAIAVSVPVGGATMTDPVVTATAGDVCPGSRAARATRSATPAPCYERMITDVAIDYSGTFGDYVYLSVTDGTSSQIIRFDHDYKAAVFYVCDRVINSIAFGDSAELGRTLFVSVGSSPGGIIQVDPLGGSHALAEGLPGLMTDLGFPTSAAFAPGLYATVVTGFPGGYVYSIDALGGGFQIFATFPPTILTGLAFGSSTFGASRLFVADEAGSIYVLDPAGQSSVFPETPAHPVNLAVSRGGAFGDHLYVSTFSGSIYRLDSDGNGALFATGLTIQNGLTGDLCFSAGGDVLYLADNNILYRFVDGSPTPLEVADLCTLRLGTPRAICRDVEVAAGPDCTASASVDGGSYDPDGDAITLTQSPPGPYRLGKTLVTLTATDSEGLSSHCIAIVSVVDMSPPTIGELSVDPPVLSPPNQKMTSVAVNYDATDECGSPVCRISSVTSNETISTADYEIVDPHHVRLRADRLGSGAGRVYTMTILCTDLAGNLATGSVTVTVPHDRGKK